MSLKEAREKREEAKLLLAEGQDPADIKRAKKLAAVYGGEETFEYIAREFIALKANTWAETGGAAAQAAGSPPKITLLGGAILINTPKGHL